MVSHHMKCGWLYIFVMFQEDAATKATPFLVTTSYYCSPMLFFLWLLAQTVDNESLKGIWHGSIQKNQLTAGHKTLKCDFANFLLFKDHFSMDFQSNLVRNIPYLIHIIPVSIKTKRWKFRVTGPILHFFAVLLFVIFAVLWQKIWSSTKLNIPYGTLHNHCY